MRCLFAIQVFGALLLFQSVVYQTCAGTPACVQADWHASLDRIGWSKCPKTNTYFKGLWRHEGTEGDKRVGRIEFGRCCEAEDPSYVNQPASCGIITWKSTYNFWALCPNGFFLNGLKAGRGLPAFLPDISAGQGKCCRPQNHPNSYEDCYDEDVTISFNKKRWSKCRREGYYMAGFYKSSCDKLNCIKKFRCCKMNKGPIVCPHGWVLHGVSHSCYLIIDTPTIHRNDARKKCQQFGADLAKITSAIENKFIFDHLRKQNTVTSYGVWLGLHRKADTKFFWADGTPLTGYTAWNATTPSSLDEKCGHMIGNGPSGGKWNDIRCTFPIEFNPGTAPVILCQKMSHLPAILSLGN